jgi:hypothetical protein
MLKLAANMMLAAAFGLLFQASSLAFASSQTGGAVFPSMHHEFGTVKQGEKVVHGFAFRNETATPLSIKQVDLSEAGMTARFKRAIPPGEQGMITLAWDTSKVKGEVKGDAIVHFADSSQPPVILALGGTVKPPIEIQPYPAAFFSTFKGEGARRKLTIINNEDHPLAITRIEPDGKHFTASLETVTPGKVYRLDVEIPSGVPPGRYMEAVYLHTDHPAFARMKVQVNVLVKDELYVNPESVDYGSISRAHVMKTPGLADLLTQTFLVKKRTGAFTIKSITSDVPAVELKRSPDSGKDDIFQIHAGLKRELLQPGEIKGNIVIETDDPQFPRLTVPVRAEVHE